MGPETIDSGPQPADAAKDDEAPRVSTEAWSTNAAYGQESATLTATVKMADPLRAPTNEGSVTFTVESSVGVQIRSVTSGPVSVGTATALFPLNLLPVGSFTVRATYNRPGSGSIRVGGSEALVATLIVRQSDTTTTLGAAFNPSTTGRGVTFTATVFPQAGGTPTGVVNFFNRGAIPIGSGTLSLIDGQAVATFSTRAFSGVVNDVTAEYIGDGNFMGSRSGAPVLQMVAPAAPPLPGRSRDR
jgi:hypothetical protein